MKKPTLEEVKEYFKNAETVQCLDDNDEYILDLTQDFDVTKTCIWLLNQIDKPFSGSNTMYMIWSEEEGYAKILTYKEPKVNIITLSEPIGDYVIFNGKKYMLEEEPKEESFVITREQIIHLSERFGNDNSNIRKSALTERLTELFPSAFEPEKKELVVDKWYKSNIGTLAFYSGNEENYGISTCGNWNDQLITKTNWNKCESGIWTEATQQEVEEALKAEFIKKGYKEDSYVKYPWFEESKTYQPVIKGEIEYIEDENSLYVGDVRIFNQGQWAEIIQPKKMTKAEIETELGYCVEIVKE